MHKPNAKLASEIRHVNKPYGSFTCESDFALVVPS